MTKEQLEEAQIELAKAIYLKLVVVRDKDFGSYHIRYEKETQAQNAISAAEVFIECWREHQNNSLNGYK